jgi:hypothetical protein
VQHKLTTAHSGAARPRAADSAARFMADLAVERLLGRGGFGVCYRANASGATVAVKVAGRAPWGSSWASFSPTGHRPPKVSKLSLLAAAPRRLLCR